MRKLILVEFEAQTGPLHVFKGYRLVVVNNGPEETEGDLMVKAAALFERQFSNHFPESTIISIMPYATWGEGAASRKNDSAVHFTNFHPMSEHPEELEDQDFTDDVLIDVDGNRKTFRVGYYDTENDKWHLYDHDEKIDLENMKWCYLPINKDLQHQAKV